MQYTRSVFLAAIFLVFKTVALPQVSDTVETADKSAINQSPDNIRMQKRLWLVGSAHGVTWSGTLIILNQMWYKDYPRNTFHFHNDATDWLQMDKAGHGVTAYHLSRLSYQTFKWAGLSNSKAAIWGSVSGNAMLTTIEILDGFSAEWGASLADLTANTLGSVGFLAQQLAWNDQRIVLKYSFSPSGLEQYRPDLLGKSLYENLIKDYNGQTYWISANLSALTGGSSFPEWLNIAIGYSGTGMLGSRENPVVHNSQILPFMVRHRQFYLSPDIDYSKIPTRSRTLHDFLQTLNFIKFPAPALEYNSHTGFTFHWLFF